MEGSLTKVLWRSVVAGLVPAALLAAPPAPAPEPVEWVVEEGSNLLLRVVMEEGRKACGAVLTVDPTRRRVRFEGIPGELGCRRVVEGGFSEVKTLRAQRREAGFILELEKEKEKDKAVKLVLLPLPHFKWFQAQFEIKKGGAEIDQALAQSGGAVSAGPDGGDAFTFGGVTGGVSTTSLTRVDLPKDVQDDTQKAVDLIRDAMGRQPAPAEMLREVLQGRPVDASIAELLQEPGGFASAPVRVRARLERGDGDEGFRLEEDGAMVRIVPEPTAEARFAAASAWIGKDVEVLARLRRATDSPDGATRGVEYFLAAWECIGPDVAATAEGKPVTLPVLLAGMTDYEGEVVRVVGRFRGRNLYGDLPARSQKGTADWVIKSERAAVWVTGHKPGGDGWTLNLETPGNGEWLEVVGRPRVRNGVAYVQAVKVALVAAPRGARVVPPRRLLSSTPTDPPSVVFSLPLEGEAIETGTRIVVQFDRNMDEESFKDRVRLREEAGAEIGVRLMYDESRRSLVVSPVRAPQPGRRVRVELMPGIVDVDGMPLAPRPGRAAEGEVVDVLRYDVSGG